MENIDFEQAKKYGISTNHQLMDSGELRFRLNSEHGSCYILTKAKSEQYWQNSHVHYHKKELYLVEKGWVIIALMKEKVEFIKLSENESLMIMPNIPHNLYISKDAIIHTIKYGSEDTDWYPYPKLDEICKKSDISELI